MNRDRCHGVWKQVRGRLIEHWGAITGDPRAVAAGRRERREGTLLERNSISRQAADRQLEEFKLRNRDWLDLSG